MKSRNIAVIAVCTVSIGVWASAQSSDSIATNRPAAAGTSIDIKTLDLSAAYPWTEADPDKQYEPEIEAEREKAEWKKNVKFAAGLCNFIDELGKLEYVCIYARVILESASSCKVHLSMGSDDCLAVFVHGKKVFQKNAIRALTPDQDQADVELQRGRNELLFRVTQGTGDMALQVSATVLGNAKVTQVPADDQRVAGHPVVPVEAK